MQVSDEKVWKLWQDNNTDPYGHAIIVYAERWANLMEEGMASGMPLETIAKKASRDADIDGITGFMYGAAVEVLKTSWVHGEALRRWHNLNLDPKNGAKANESGGVLNPAILTIKTK